MNIDNVKLLKSKVQKAAAFFRQLAAALDEVLDLGAVVAKAEQDKANLAAELESIRQETTEAIAKRQEVNAEAERIIADAREAGKKVAREAIDGARAVIDDMAKEEEEKVKYLDKLTSSCLNPS